MRMASPYRWVRPPTADVIIELGALATRTGPELAAQPVAPPRPVACSPEAPKNGGGALGLSLMFGTIAGALALATAVGWTGTVTSDATGVRMSDLRSVSR